MIKVLVIVCWFSLVSCMSIPLSSMIKMAGLTSNDILAINPNEVRVRLSVSDPIELQRKNVRLALQFEYSNGDYSEYKYLLEIIDVKKINPISNWFFSEPLKHAYNFQLANLSKLEFNNFKKQYLIAGKPKRYYWTVYYYLKNKSSINKNASIDMELKLSKQEEFFYLLKNADIDINNLSEPKKVN